MNKQLMYALAFSALAAVTGPAQAATVGGFDDGFVGCDVLGACSITLDEQGHISGVFAGFFGPYDTTLTRIASTVNPAYAGLEVTSYEFVGKGGAPMRLIGGALGLCDSGVSADGLACTGPGGDTKGDVLVFTPNPVVDALGFGHTIIDFLSDGGSDFAFTTAFNVLEVGPQGSNSAFYRAGPSGTTGADMEFLDFNIISDAAGNIEIPEPASLALLALALTGLGFCRRKSAS